MQKENANTLSADARNPRDDAAGARKLDDMEAADPSVTAMMVRVIGLFMKGQATAK